jgi:hypothetical protein
VVDEYSRDLSNPDEINASVQPLRHFGNALVAMPLTLAAPDPQLPGPAGYIPFTGTAESLIGLGKYIYDSARTVSNATGLTNLPPAPQVMDTAARNFGENYGTVKGGVEKYTGGVLQQPDMNTPEGQFTDITGSAVGGGIGVAPAGVLRALPTGLKTLGSYLIPTVTHTPRNMAVSGVLGTTTGLIDTAAQAQTEAAAQAQTTPDKNAAQTATPPALSTYSQAQSTPQPPPVQPLSSYSGVDENKPLSSYAAPAGPTFTQQGETSVPVWAAGAGLIISLGAIAGGRYVHGIGAHMTDIARDARFNDPGYAAKAQAYNDSVKLRGNSTASITDPGIAPPVPQGNLVRRTTTYLADKTANDVASLQNMLKLSSNDPAVGDRLSSMVGNIYDTQLTQNKSANFMESGYDKITGLSIPSPIKVLKDFAGLTDRQKVVLGDGLRSLNELDNRKKNTTAWLRENPGVPPSLENIAHDFIGKPSDLLDANATAMRADPVLNDIATRFKAIHDGMINIGAHPNYNFFSAAEQRDILGAHPHYAGETDMNGLIMHPFGERTTTPFTGQSMSTTHPVLDMAQHVEKMYPLFEQNNLSRELYNHWKDIQRTYPNSAQLMSDIAAPVGPHTSYYPISGDIGGTPRDPIVTVRDGGVKHVHVDDPILFHAMSGKGLSHGRIRLDAFDKARKLYQQGTTGMASLATGRAIPLRNMLYTAMSMPINAPRNMRAGMLDRAYQRATGLQANPIVRGLDIPLNIARVPISYLHDAMHRNVTQRFAEITAPGAKNHVNAWLRSLMGDATVDTMHQSARSRWENSGAAYTHGLGIGGQGSPMHMEPPGVVTGRRAGPFNTQTPQGLRLISAKLAPKAFFDGQWMGAKPFALNVERAVAEAMSHMSDAGHDYFAKLNRDNPNVDPHTLTYETRNLVGNPVRRGSGSAIGVARAVLPYSNVSIQGYGRRMRAMGEHPLATATTAAIGHGTLAALSILTHMRSAAHMDYLQNELSLQQREANVALALNDDPHKPTSIPLAQEDRLPYAFALDIMAKAINTIAARHDPDYFNMVWEGLKDFLSSHITTSNWRSMIHGGIDAGDFINLPPMLGRVDWNAVSQGQGLDAVHSPWSATVRDTPGMTPDTVLDSSRGQVFRNILSNTLGAMGASMFDLYAGTSRYHHQGHPFWESMGMSLKDWAQVSKENNQPLNNILWEVPVRLSVQPPIVESLQPTMYALKNLPPIVSEAQIGFTNKGPNQLPMPNIGDRKVAQDPMMQHMLRVAHGYDTRIQHAMQPINALKQQMSGVQKMGMNPQDRRVWLNQQTRNIADRYKLVDQLAEDMNAMLSKFAGKGIRIQDIDWSKGVEQFHE